MLYNLTHALAVNVDLFGPDRGLDLPVSPTRSETDIGPHGVQEAIWLLKIASKMHIHSLQALPETNCK